MTSFSDADREPHAIVSNGRLVALAMPDCCYLLVDDLEAHAAAPPASSEKVADPARVAERAVESRGRWGRTTE